MFTGITETIGTLESIEIEESNKVFKIKSEISSTLKVDQSVAHDGACLTVTKTDGQSHWVTAIGETLSKTNLGTWEVGQKINLERCLKLGDRLDGHWVQGHVDTVGMCTSLSYEGGSWKFEFSYKNSLDYRTVAKGSITINGCSLTVVESFSEKFSVAIIPYTFDHTTFKTLKIGSFVNLEFDILGKWVKEWMK